jgi:c(7)-type cytochrome triheme protein
MRPRTTTTVFLSIFLQILLGSTVALSAVPGDIHYERRAIDSPEASSELSSFPPAVFPHWIHRIHYRCDACHDDLFEMKRGGTPVTMELMGQGKVCGACHNGQTAFGSEFQTCNRCHVAAEE